MATLYPEVERLRSARDGFARLRGRVEASEAAPDGGGNERDWVPREILAHVAEMLPYWRGEIERVLAGSPEPVPFGRTSDDPIRSLTVERDRSLPVAELYARLDAGVDRVVLRLLELDDRAVAKRGLHPRRGPMTVQEIVDVMLAGHLEEHYEQLATALEMP